jgi:hypothetical protein
MEGGGLDASRPSPGGAPDVGSTCPVKPDALPLPKSQDVIHPTYVRTFFAVLNGAKTVREVVAVTGLGETTTSSHLKRLRGLGLVDWHYTARNQRGVRHIRPCVTEVEFTAWCEKPVEAPHVLPEQPPIIDVRELSKGDVLTIEGEDYTVKEVRIGKTAKHAAIRLAIPNGEWWHKQPLDQPIQAVRTAAAQQRIDQAIEARDGMYRYGR